MTDPVKSCPPPQSKASSFMEALCGALCAAPTAMGLNDFMLYIWGDVLTDPQVKSTYLIISWFSFFLHSIGWKYLLRRIFIKYAWEPKHMYHFLVRKFSILKSKNLPDNSVALDSMKMAEDAEFAEARKFWPR